ncbi:MAG TPA: DUF3727 domain-containing protein [Leptolyngbyaceae cyanobacterium M65_K2018_010]|nr:DUF3727 domain-containing protein [Leptolyngbyaceae cyanobacterium M65_K2018_010]
MADASQSFEESAVVLSDEAGRFLPCQVEQRFELNNEEYFLLLPIDSPIEIFVWQQDDSDEEVLMDIEEEEIDQIFLTAKAVLAEQNLILQRSAITLTAAGELPEVEEDNCLTLELDEVDETGAPMTEEFQILATCFYDDEEYTLCTPLEPLLIFAHRGPQGTLEVVTPEEFQAIRGGLEEKLFDLLE